MSLPRDANDIKERLNHARGVYQARDSLVELCREMYRMVKDRKSTFMGRATSWRGDVEPQYWQSSNRPHNAVDIATAVLSGHPPQYKVTSPGAPLEDVCSRAEKFLEGVWRANSRWQAADLYRRLVFRTIRDGAAGIRVTWNTQAPEPEMREVEDRWVAYYPKGRVPIDIRIVSWNKLYPLGHPTQETPFSELLHVDGRTLDSVVAEWKGVQGARIPKGLKLSKDQVGEYVEWWGFDSGEVHYMVTFEDSVVVPRTVVPYGRIPYVIAAYKEDDDEDPVFSHVPFVFPLIWATDREEYLRSRILRLVDLWSGMLPYHRGGSPVNISGAWGKIINLLDEKERIEFPMWPGTPPDVWRVLEDAMRAQNEASFSQAMYGEVSTRISGYGLSQLIGADTLRMDTPRANLELALAAAGELILDHLRWFSPAAHVAVAVRSKDREITVTLAGHETEHLVLDVFLKPKQSADEIRLAVIGAQLASLPKPPVSMEYILERFFGISQPEDEIQKVLSDEALRDPLVRLVAMAEVLRENDSPYMPLIAAQIMAAAQKVSAATGGGGIGGIGMGMPQATMGNPTEGPEPDEVGDTSESLLWGGPRE